MCCFNIISFSHNASDTTNLNQGYVLFSSVVVGGIVVIVVARRREKVLRTSEQEEISYVILHYCCWQGKPHQQSLGFEHSMSYTSYMSYKRVHDSSFDSGKCLNLFSNHILKWDHFWRLIQLDRTCLCQRQLVDDWFPLLKSTSLTSTCLISTCLTSTVLNDYGAALGGSLKNNYIILFLFYTKTP